MRNAILIGTAAALTLGACAHKKKDLPPAPPTVAPATQVQPDGVVPPAGDASGGQGTTGARARFVAAAGADTVRFATDSYELDDQAKAILIAQAAWLASNAQVRANVEGHCDERGSREYNLALGERRANAAKTFLAAHGVAADRLTVISYGKERPVAEGSDEEAYAKNRRAVTVVPE